MIKELIKIAMWTMGIGIVLTCCLANIKTGVRTCEGEVWSQSRIYTNDGHVWIYDHDCEEGAYVRVTFDTRGTDDVYDDIIIKVQEL